MKNLFLALLAVQSLLTVRNACADDFENNRKSTFLLSCEGIVIAGHGVEEVSVTKAIPDNTTDKVRFFTSKSGVYTIDLMKITNKNGDGVFLSLAKSADAGTIKKFKLPGDSRSMLMDLGVKQLDGQAFNFEFSNNSGTDLQVGLMCTVTLGNP